MRAARIFLYCLSAPFIRFTRSLWHCAWLESLVEPSDCIQHSHLSQNLNCCRRSSSILSELVVISGRRSETSIFMSESNRWWILLWSCYCVNLPFLLLIQLSITCRFCFILTKRSPTISANTMEQPHDEWRDQYIWMFGRVMYSFTYNIPIRDRMSSTDMTKLGIYFCPAYMMQHRTIHWITSLFRKHFYNCSGEKEQIEHIQWN